MKIRPFQHTDKPQLIKLMSEFGDYIESIDKLNKTSYPKKGAEYFVDKLISDSSSHKGIIYIAEDGSEVIGFIGGYPTKQSDEELMEAKEETVGVISEFFVTQSYRSKGVGRALMAIMEEFLINQKCTLIRLEVFGPNQTARDFYAKNGYQERSVVVSKYFKSK